MVDGARQTYTTQVGRTEAELSIFYGLLTWLDDADGRNHWKTEIP